MIVKFSVNNFIKHVNDFHYDGLIFHRVIKGFMIQTGGFTFDFTARESERSRIVNEASNGLKNLRGTIAMARTSAPDSAQAQFFINLIDTEWLAGKHTVFGRVRQGMDILDAIGSTPVDEQDRPLQDVRIIQVKVLP